MARRESTKRVDLETAYHEAGHAVVSYLLGVGVKSISIVQEGDSGGRVISTDRKFNPELQLEGDRRDMMIEREIIILLAGMHAGRLRTGRLNHFGASQDRAMAWDMAAYRFGLGDTATAYLKYLNCRSRSLVSMAVHRPAIDRLAEALLVHKRLSGRKAKEIIRQAYRDAVPSKRG